MGDSGCIFDHERSPCFFGWTEQKNNSFFASGRPRGGLKATGPVGGTWDAVDQIYFLRTF
jgi:hypothetical protein